jgi:hypothetical protein
MKLSSRALTATTLLAGAVGVVGTLIVTSSSAGAAPAVGAPTTPPVVPTRPIHTFTQLTDETPRVLVGPATGSVAITQVQWSGPVSGSSPAVVRLYRADGSTDGACKGVSPAATPGATLALISVPSGNVAPVEQSLPTPIVVSATSPAGSVRAPFCVMARAESLPDEFSEVTVDLTGFTISGSTAKPSDPARQ